MFPPSHFSFVYIFDSQRRRQPLTIGRYRPDVQQQMNGGGGGGGQQIPMQPQGHNQSGAPGYGQQQGGMQYK